MACFLTRKSSSQFINEDSAIAYRFSEHGMMDENQQTSITQELGRLLPSIRSREKRGETSELLKVGAGESSASATDTNMGSKSNIKETTEAYVA